MRALTVVLGVFLLAACGDEPIEFAEADRVLTNGVILTMNAQNAVADAVAISGAHILAVGSVEEIGRHIGAKTEVTNLFGRTVTPGFIDAHGHFPFSGDIALNMVDLNSPPMGTIGNMEELVDTLRAKAQARSPGEWIVGIGYDDTLLPEKRHPTRAELDAVSTKHPVFIWHTSLHLAVVNSEALRRAEIEPRRHSGLLRELAEMGPIMALIPQPGTEERVVAIEHAALDYASRGVTTAQSGLTDERTLGDLAAALAQDRMPIRVLIWPSPDVARKLNSGKLDPEITDPQRLKIGAVKMIADGSIQGYTGYLSEPYYVTPKGKPDYRGAPIMPREALVDLIGEFHAAGWQVAVHGNGDAAIDDILAGFEAMLEADPRDDVRPIIVHSQMAREDQLDVMARLGVIPSFFSLHTYYWGDRHREIFMGPMRASHMSPARSAAGKGILFTIHADTPVTPMEPLRLMWAAVNRLSKTGEFVGSDQRIDPIQALRAITIDAAYQSFDEVEKGSIEPGKLADLVVLSANPLDQPETIDDIEVVETILGGASIYSQAQDQPGTGDVPIDVSPGVQDDMPLESGEEAP